MDGYQEKVSSVSVPKNTGVEGFLKTLRGILSLPRVQSIAIDASGKVRYTRYVRDGEAEGPIQIDYTGLDPWSVIRNGELEEMPYEPGTSATNVIAAMFNRVTREGLAPVAFATGADSHFWKWHERAGVSLVRKSTAYGLPIHTDRQMPDHSLVMCASYIRGSLIDCHRFISVSMDQPDFVPPETTVTIL